MEDKYKKTIRIVLLVVIVLLLLLPFGLYFYTGMFRISPLITALGCLLVFIITGKKKAR